MHPCFCQQWDYWVLCIQNDGLFDYLQTNFYLFLVLLLNGQDCSPVLFYAVALSAAQLWSFGQKRLS